jgi:hypothetical protein
VRRRSAARGPRRVLHRRCRMPRSIGSGAARAAAWPRRRHRPGRRDVRTFGAGRQTPIDISAPRGPDSIVPRAPGGQRLRPSHVATSWLHRLGRPGRGHGRGPDRHPHRAGVTSLCRDLVGSWSRLCEYGEALRDRAETVLARPPGGSLPSLPGQVGRTGGSTGTGVLSNREVQSRIRLATPLGSLRSAEPKPVGTAANRSGPPSGFSLLPRRVDSDDSVRCAS